MTIRAREEMVVVVGPPDGQAEENEQFHNDGGEGASGILGLARDVM